MNDPLMELFECVWKRVSGPQNHLVLLGHEYDGACKYIIYMSIYMILCLNLKINDKW